MSVSRSFAPPLQKKTAHFRARQNLSLCAVGKRVIDAWGKKAKFAACSGFNFHKTEEVSILQTQVLLFVSELVSASMSRLITPIIGTLG